MAARGKKLLKVRRRAMFKHSKWGIRRDDQVQIMAGDEQGKIGRILRVLPARERVVVEGANKVFKHVRRSQQNPQGGRIESEAPIHIANVLVLCGKCGRGVRTRVRLEEKRKIRVCVKCGTDID